MSSRGPQRDFANHYKMKDRYPVGTSVYCCYQSWVDVGMGQEFVSLTLWTLSANCRVAAWPLMYHSES